LFVLDMNTGKVLFKTFVAHGKNSGLEYATNFSNEEESYKTSLGFFITCNTYNGSNGYSLKLKGCEKGINDKAAERAIVMHGAPYANEDFLDSNGYLGRSFGCPAVPEKMNKKIIDIIKNGSCLFLYHPTKKYINASKILGS
jgi:L,D-transpeptidase catalytic domain